MLKYSTREDSTQFPPLIFDPNSKKEKRYEERFYFILTRYGLEIGNNQGCKLCSEKGEVAKVASQRVLWCDPMHPSFNNDKAGYWQLIKADHEQLDIPVNEDFYLIGMNYGDTFPRIVAMGKDKLGQ